MDIITRVCDMPGVRHGAGTPTRREFSVDGQDLEIDLCMTHDQPFMDMVDKWAQAARRGAEPQPAPQPRRSRTQRERSASIRAWAASTGRHVETSGRIPVSVVRDYDKAHS